MRAWCVLTVLLLAVQACGSGSGNPVPGNDPGTVVLSAPDCAGPENIVAEEATAPVNATYLRVQHIGDAGTAELAGEIANRVTWNVGDYTGFYPPDPAGTGTQRGFRNLPPPAAASAFQLSCGGAGFLINTWQFSHSLPLVGSGPSASVARNLSPEAALFRDARSTLAIDATINLRHAAYQTPHVAEGTAQISFFYYMRDATTGVVIAHLVALFDSRPPGIGGVGLENVASDGEVAYITSPLAERDAAGVPVQFVTVSPPSDVMRFEQAWNRPIYFRAQVPYEKVRALLARLRAGPHPGISPRPEDYRVLSFGVLGEVFPGTGSEHNVSIGASVFDLRLSGT
jgi:hypothetical protein